jgi:nitrogen fixation/metabolism regulation signal transduction histidine kinase
MRECNAVLQLVESKCLKIKRRSLKRDMKITHKLTLVIVIGLVAIIGLGEVAYYSVKSMEERFSELVELPIASILRLGHMTEAFALSVDEARLYRQYGTEEAREAYFQKRDDFDMLLAELKRELGYGTPTIPQQDTVFIDAISVKTEILSSLIAADFHQYEQGQKTSPSADDPFREQEGEIMTLIGQYRDMEKEEIRLAHEAAKHKTAQTNTFLFVFILSFIVVNIVINGFLARSIIRPLALLTEMAKGFGGGDMGKRVHSPGNDELGIVANAFNEMADNIQQSHGNLELQIQERTSDLKKQLSDLEKMNMLMIDRELKMVELKKRNKELQSSQGQGTST